MSIVGPLFLNLIGLIQLCDKKNLTLVLKNFTKLAKGSLNNIFQDPFNKNLSQQLTHDRSYISLTLNLTDVHISFIADVNRVHYSPRDP